MTAYFSESIEDRESISYVVWKLWAFPQRKNLVIFSSFFIITFDWIENFESWLYYRKYLVQIYQNISCLNVKKYFCMHKNPFLGEKLYFLGIFEIHLSKSVDFKTFIYEVDTIYTWTIWFMCYVKVLKYIIAICSLFLHRGFLIRCAILVR